MSSARRKNPTPDFQRKSTLTPEKKTVKMMQNRWIDDTSQNKNTNSKSNQKGRNRDLSPVSQNGHLASQSSARTLNPPRKMKFAAETQALTKDLSNNMSKLCSCLEIYSILENNLQSQRCLQHNNTLSLYCLTQRRILCVNCLYGIHKHRSHKVVPLKDCMNEVYEDNKKLADIIEEQLKRMDYYGKVAEENSVIIETEMRRALSNLDADYRSKIDEIKVKYEQAKESIVGNFTPIVESSRKVHKQIQDFRFKIWNTYNLYVDSKITDQSQVMKQLLFVNLVELCEVRCRTITKTQLDQLSRRVKIIT